MIESETLIGDKVFYPHYLSIPREVYMNENITPLAMQVYAVIYWYEQLEHRVCYASNRTIAGVLQPGTHPKSVSRCITMLEEGGLIGVGEFGDKRRLTTLVVMTKVGIHERVEGYPRTGYHPLHERVTHNKNNNKNNKNSLVQKHKNEVGKLYNGWLISMVIGSRVWLATPESERDPLLASAAKKVRLTEPRKEKLARSIDKLGYSSCANAIKNIAHSEHHRGVNDRGWKATIDWLFKSYEKTEEWANR